MNLEMKLTGILSTSYRSLEEKPGAATAVALSDPGSCASGARLSAQAGQSTPQLRRLRPCVCAPPRSMQRPQLPACGPVCAPAHSMRGPQLPG